MKNISEWKCAKEGCDCDQIEEVAISVRSHSVIGEILDVDSGSICVADYTDTSYYGGDFSHYECRLCGEVITEEEITKFLKGES